MSKRFGFTVKGFSLSVENADGEFVPVSGIAPLGPEFRTIEAHVLSERQTRPIVCYPIPGRDGIEYVQDWLGLTHFG